MADKHLHPETLAISTGRPQPAPGVGLNSHISLNSTYRAGGDINYGRFGNENWHELEFAISALEEAQSTLVFASGMAAITAVFSLLPHGAPVVASHEGYSGTMSLLKRYHAEGRLEVRFVDITKTEEVVTAIKGAALLWLESPTNPCLDVADLPALIAAAKKQTIGVGVDNTFATPMVQTPLSMGADIVMHSVTKFLAGHSDVVLGSLSISDSALFKRLEESRRLNGSIPGPFEAWLALRGIRTFPVRFRAAEANAKTLVTRLQKHAKVTKVRYPGFGAVISFEIDGNAENAEKVCESSRLITHATSLGGVESL